MLKGLRRLGTGMFLLRGIFQELRMIREALQVIAAAHAPEAEARVEPAAVDEITYVHEDQQEELMEIELRLTAARGAAPTDEEIHAEWERRHPDLMDGQHVQ